jgi:hypothetical protein
VVAPPTEKGPLYLTPPPTNTLGEILHNLWQMLVYWPLWDVSYLTAQAFTWGSVIWVINAFFAWLPAVRPSSEFPSEKDAAGITAFIGATIFEVGSVFLMIEAANENRTDCFGWALEELLEDNGLVRVTPDRENCTHHHANKLNIVGKERSYPKKHGHDRRTGRKNFPEAQELDSWVWLPTLHELRAHYVHDIGFLACLSQFLGATVFWISGFTALPPIQAALSTPGINGAYWAPQVIGGIGFIVSSLLFCLETQQKWWKPAPQVLGWWVGAWNLIGAVGFTLSGAFGYWVGSQGTYEAGLSTFWASWAFLIGSCVQWYESLVKHPVEVESRKGMTGAWPRGVPEGEHHLHSTDRIPSLVQEKKCEDV